MKKRLHKIFVTIALSACLCTFGGWTNAALPQEERYGDAALLSAYASETISFTRKDDSVQNATDGNAPKYENHDNLSNACGAVAGAIVVGYYDKYAPDLIAGWTSHFTSGKYRKQDQTYVPAVIRELYTAMRTNVDGKGVSESDFLSGLRQYASVRNYTASFTRAATATNIDFAACKNAIDNNKVIVLFSHAGNVYKILAGANMDNIETITLADSHIMVACGYKQIKYYNANGLFRTDTYLEVKLGKNEIPSAYYKVSANILSSAYIVDIQ